MVFHYLCHSQNSKKKDTVWTGACVLAPHELFCYELRHRPPFMVDRRAGGWRVLRLGNSGRQQCTPEMKVSRDCERAGVAPV